MAAVVNADSVRSPNAALARQRARLAESARGLLTGGRNTPETGGALAGCGPLPGTSLPDPSARRPRPARPAAVRPGGTDVSGHERSSRAGVWDDRAGFTPGGRTRQHPLRTRADIPGGPVTCGRALTAHSPRGHQTRYAAVGYHHGPQVT